MTKYGHICICTYAHMPDHMDDISAVPIQWNEQQARASARTLIEWKRCHALRTFRSASWSLLFERHFFKCDERARVNWPPVRCANYTFCSNSSHRAACLPPPLFSWLFTRTLTPLPEPHSCFLSPSLTCRSFFSVDHSHQ